MIMKADEDRLLGQSKCCYYACGMYELVFIMEFQEDITYLEGREQMY